MGDTKCQNCNGRTLHPVPCPDGCGMQRVCEKCAKRVLVAVMRTGGDDG